VASSNRRRNPVTTSSIEIRPGSTAAAFAPVTRLLTNPWVDKAFAVAAIFPFAYPVIHHFSRLGVNLPEAVYVIQTSLLVGTMVFRTAPVRITTNPIFWGLAFLATYWGFIGISLEDHGTRVAPVWLLDTITLSTLAGIFWARLSLGRNIGFVPAQREIVTRGAYRFVRHPIYAVVFVSIVGAMLERWSLRNVIVLGAGILLFGVKSFVEEGLLVQDPTYAAYMRRVRYRFIPGII
jgi:protein-S-isoprenylcysteine O-methyltransferase Ste14